MDPDSTNVEKKQIPKESFPPCDVCGENGTGLHYGVNSCEACKVNFSIISVCPFFTNCARWESAYFLLNNGIITARKRNLRRLCFYRCLSVHGGHAWQRGHEWQRRGVCMAGGCAWQGGMHGGGHVGQGGHVWCGACMTGGCVWQGGMHGRGVCVVGGMCGRGACMAGGMHGDGGVCVAGGCACHAHPPGRYYRIGSMSGWYASYWNAFLL